MVESVWELPRRSSGFAVMGGLDEGFDSPQKRWCRSGMEASAPCDIGRGRAGPTLGCVAKLVRPRDVAVSVPTHGASRRSGSRTDALC